MTETELRAEIDRLKRDVLALEHRLDDLSAPPSRSGQAADRRTWLKGMAVGVLGASYAAAASIRPAKAANGDPILAGAVNFETAATSLVYAANGMSSQYYALGILNLAVPSIRNTGAFYGQNDGQFQYGVIGYDGGATTGSESLGGVYGISTNYIGVTGFSQGTTNQGIGVLAWGVRTGLKALTSGSSHQNIAAIASANGAATALAVDGMLRLSEAGMATIAAGQSTITITLQGAADPATSLAHATLIASTSTHFVTGAVVTSASTKAGAFTHIKITLNAAAPTGGLKVGWFLLHLMGDVLTIA